MFCRFNEPLHPLLVWSKGWISTIHTQGQLAAARGNAVPSDLEIRNCSMSEVLSGLAVVLVAGILIVDERLDIPAVGLEGSCLGCTLVGIVLAMTAADDIGGRFQPSQT